MVSHRRWTIEKRRRKKKGQELEASRHQKGFPLHLAHGRVRPRLRLPVALEALLRDLLGEQDRRCYPGGELGGGQDRRGAGDGAHRARAVDELGEEDGQRDEAREVEYRVGRLDGQQHERVAALREALGGEFQVYDGEDGEGRSEGEEVEGCWRWHR